MSGVAPDPLDALEHRARNVKTFTELPIGVFRDYGFRSKDEGLRKLALDVLALVEIARAAREMSALHNYCIVCRFPAGNHTEGCALGRLDKGAAPPEADPSLIKKWNPA